MTGRPEATLGDCFLVVFAFWVLASAGLAALIEYGLALVGVMR